MAKLKENYEHLEVDHPDCEPNDQGPHNCSCHLDPPCNPCVECPSHDEDAWED